MQRYTNNNMQAMATMLTHLTRFPWTFDAGSNINGVSHKFSATDPAGPHYVIAGKTKREAYEKADSFIHGWRARA